MIDHRQNEIVIVEGLKAYLSVGDRPCEVVRQNQVAEVPPYPYGAYTVTMPISGSKGTYSEAEDGTLYRNIEQTWSFTIQSDDQDEAMSLALRAYDFFTVAGHVLLADHGISVIRVQPVTNRDNLISIEYEFRKGLDVTFGLLTTINEANKGGGGVIEHYNYKEE